MRKHIYYMIPNSPIELYVQFLKETKTFGQKYIRTLLWSFIVVVRYSDF